MKKTLKQIISIFLVIVLTCTGCTLTNESSTTELTTASISEEQTTEIIQSIDSAPSFSGLDDEDLLRYIEDDVYEGLISELNSDEYFVESVTAVYLSKEYIEELEYNSQSNVYFGYTLSELDEVFQGKKYVFTLGEDNTTVVEEMQVIDDSWYYEALKNIAIGTGVILICVTVSVVTAGSAPAVSMIFAASAKGAATFATPSALISGVSSGIVTGYQTGDFEEALKAGITSGSEEFKWGAFTGAVLGGTSEAFLLKGATAGGLTMNEAARIQKETKWAKDFIKQFKSIEEYEQVVAQATKAGMTLKEVENIWKVSGYSIDVIKMISSTDEAAIYIEQAGLTSKVVNGQAALVREIDLAYESELAGETVTNLERMKRGYAAIDPITGEAYQLHHIGQSTTSPLAILTQAEHTGGGNNNILHDPNIADGQGVHSLMSDSEWTKQKREFWKAYAELFE